MKRRVLVEPQYCYKEVRHALVHEGNLEELVFPEAVQREKPPECCRKADGQGQTRDQPQEPLPLVGSGAGHTCSSTTNLGRRLVSR